MSVCLLLTAFAAGQPMAMPPPGWPAYHAPAYAGAYPMPMPVWQTSYGPPNGPYYGPPPPPPGPYGYQYAPPMPVGYATSYEPQGMHYVSTGGGCASGNCGNHGYLVMPSHSMLSSACCDEGKRHRLFHRFRKHDDECCEPAPDCCCEDSHRGGLLARLRKCFKRDKHDNCETPECTSCEKPRCDTCDECKPSLRDRLKKCFHREDDCDQCDKPSLHDRLRDFFHRCKDREETCCASPANGCTSCQPSGCKSCQASPAHAAPPMPNLPAEILKEPKEKKEDNDPGARLPQGPPIHVIKEVPF